MTDTTYVSGPGITSGRYKSRPDGDVFDTWGGYAISADLWERRLAEGRSDSARHSFVYEDAAPVSYGQGWFGRPVRCERCGERRTIMCELGQLNRTERWCVAAPPFRASTAIGLVLVVVAICAGLLLMASIA